jgi:hypothetical protein
MLEGDVALESFVEALGAFNKMIAGLSEEVGGGITWTLEELAYSSAITSIRGEAPQRERVYRVVRDYAAIGRSLQTGFPIRHTGKVVRSAHKIGRLIGRAPGIRAVRFETEKEETVLVQPPKRVAPSRLTAQALGFPLFEQEPLREPNGAYGSVEGLVQTLTSRHGLRFTLYDSLNDRAVSCYLQSGQREMMRDVWEKRAIVAGWVTRDPSTGHAVAIRQVSEVVPVEEGDFTQARDALPLTRNSLFPERLIRQIRDE